MADCWLCTQSVVTYPIWLRTRLFVDDLVPCSSTRSQIRSRSRWCCSFQCATCSADRRRSTRPMARTARKLIALNSACGAAELLLVLIGLFHVAVLQVCHLRLSGAASDDEKCVLFADGCHGFKSIPNTRYLLRRCEDSQQGYGINTPFV